MALSNNLTPVVLVAHMRAVMREDWDGQGRKGMEVRERGIMEGKRYVSSNTRSNVWKCKREMWIKERRDKAQIYLTNQTLHCLRDKVKELLLHKLHSSTSESSVSLHCHFWSGTCSSSWAAGVSSWSGESKHKWLSSFSSADSSLKGALHRIYTAGSVYL